MNGREGCKGCGHYRSMFSNTRGCHFCFDTEEPRGCPVEGCTRYTTKKFRDEAARKDLSPLPPSEVRYG
ncbi:MAG: hypothetical protein VB035_09980 [Candidatus Fimivivens sp.]|nr:hypothetical protein [Candidatus Fimivivens sp.]